MESSALTTIKRKPERGWLIGKSLISSLTENAQEHQEQVDEVEVERKGAHDRSLSNNGSIEVCRLGHGHVLDLLCVIGREAHKNKDSDIADDHAHTAALDEQVDQGGDDDADQAHHHKTAKRRQILFGRPPVKAADDKSGGTDKKGAHNGSLGIDEKDRRKSHPVQTRIDHEKSRSQARA